MLAGQLDVYFGGGAEHLAVGDSTIIAAGETHSWANRTDTAAKVIWVEQLSAGSAARSSAEVRRRCCPARC